VISIYIYLSYFLIMTINLSEFYFDHIKLGDGKPKRVIDSRVLNVINLLLRCLNERSIEIFK